MSTWSYPKQYPFTEEEVTLNMRLIQARVRGQVTDLDWEMFREGLEILVEPAQGSTLSSRGLQWLMKVFEARKTDSHLFLALMRKVGRPKVISLWNDFKANQSVHPKEACT